MTIWNFIPTRIRARHPRNARMPGSASVINRFFADTRANIAMVFAVAIIPVIAAIGAALDYSRWADARSAVQAMVDSTAVQAVGRSRDRAALDAAERALRERLEKVAHAPIIRDLQVIRENPIEDTTTLVAVSVDGGVPTTFMRFFGFSELPLYAEARTRGELRSFEISLVLDVTGSMRFRGRLEALQDAAHGLIDTILPAGEPPGDRLLLNVVPYVTAVNIGRHRGDWLAPLDRPPHNHPPGTSRYGNRYIWTEDEISGSDCQGTGVNWDPGLRICYIGTRSVWTRPGPCPGVQINGTCHVADGWMGCVEERGRGSHSLTDATPATSPFQPYYWPSWGGVGNPDAEPRHNSYLPVPIDESAETNAMSNLGRGPNLGCPQNEITDWTNNRRYLQDTINALNPWGRSGTMTHAGLAWGWRTLSPRWAGMWGNTPAPREYDPENVEKIVIFMTDGINQFFSVEAPEGDSDYTSLGFISENDSVDHSNDQDFLDAKMLQLCTRIKDEGIEIFTIGFDLQRFEEGTQARQMLHDCASSSDHFFDTDVSNIDGAFEKIARDIRSRRERLTH
ncbi:MAG: pilus assembly protein [Salinarimonas sp.]|nr:pilus assembly protein [Salinarimonas sp.]